MRLKWTKGRRRFMVPPPPPPLPLVEVIMKGIQPILIILVSLTPRMERWNKSICNAPLRLPKISLSPMISNNTLHKAHLYNALSRLLMISNTLPETIIPVSHSLNPEQWNKPASNLLNIITITKNQSGRQIQKAPTISDLTKTIAPPHDVDDLTIVQEKQEQEERYDLLHGGFPTGAPSPGLRGRGPEVVDKFDK
jgi:hypothetical protein